RSEALRSSLALLLCACSPVLLNAVALTYFFQSSPGPPTGCNHCDPIYNRQALKESTARHFVCCVGCCRHSLPNMRRVRNSDYGGDVQASVAAGSSEPSADASSLGGSPVGEGRATPSATS